MSIADTVNRLISGFRTPDGASSANKVLGEMQFPQISSLLPYRDYDKDSGLYINNKSVGFLLEAQPLIGANEHIVQVMEDLIKNKVPRNTPVTFHLISSQVIGSMIEEGIRDFRWQGKEAEKFNRITRAYYLRAAQEQFNSPTNLPMTLRNYRLFISYNEKSKRDRVSQLTEISHLLKVIRATLDSAKLTTQTVEKDDFIKLIREMINHRPAQLYADPVKVDNWEQLNTQCVERTLDFKVTPDDIRIGLSRPGASQSKARVMNFMLEHNPDIFMLWQGGDNISNLLNPDLTISSPFIITFIMVAEDQVNSQREATTKYMDADKKAGTPYAKIFPGVTRKAAEWKEVRERLNSNQTCLVRYYFNISAFCEDSDEAALVCEQQIINTFKKNGLTLYAPKYMQMRNWMAMFPFMAAEGLWDDLKTSGATCRAESAQVVNLLPVITDNAPSAASTAGGFTGAGIRLDDYRLIDTGTIRLDPQTEAQAGHSGLNDGIPVRLESSGGVRPFTRENGVLRTDARQTAYCSASHCFPEPAAAFRRPDGVARIWIAPYVSPDSNVHMGEVIYSVSSHGDWSGILM